MVLAICMNATVLLEQPRNSFLEYYPRFRDWMEMLRNIGGVNAVPCFIHYVSHQVTKSKPLVIFQFIESILAIFARVVPQVGRIQTGLVPTSFNLWLGSSWYGIVPWFDFIPIPHYARYSPWLRPTEWNGGCLYTVDLHRRDMSFGQTHPWSSGCILELWRDGLNLLRLKKLLVKSMSGLFRNIPTRRGTSAGKAMLDWSPVSQKLIFQKTHFIKSRW